MNEHSFLSHGEHDGYVWFTRYNSIGFRMGYVVIPTGHPWHGEDDYNRLGSDIHVSLTFAANVEDFFVPGAIKEFYNRSGHLIYRCSLIGFDCEVVEFDCSVIRLDCFSVNEIDVPDPELLDPDVLCPKLYEAATNAQDYVERKCRRLCEQVNEAAK